MKRTNDAKYILIIPFSTLFSEDVSHSVTIMIMINSLNVNLTLN